MQFLPSLDNIFSVSVFGVFALMAFLILLYTLLIYGRLAFYKPGKRLTESELPGVSIIVAARNEADNLFENLPYLLQQNYPEFEVIVINHQSIDDSSHLLNAYKRQYNNLHVIEVARSPHLKPGKKLPLTLGIKGAKYEHLLFTDADCKPSSNVWLKSMASCFVDGKEIVLGYGPYTKEKGFLNRLIRFDTSWIAMNYFSMALAKLPYMGVGRNMAYTKRTFESVQGFKSHYFLPSGDDDLFIQQAAKKKNYTVNLDKFSYCYSEPHSTWSGWIRQKSRHYATSDYYSVIKKALLGIYPLLTYLLLISFVILLLDKEFRWISLAAFTLLTGIKWWIQARCFKKMEANSFVGYLPFWDLLYTILMPVIYYSTEKKATNKW